MRVERGAIKRDFMALHQVADEAGVSCVLLSPFGGREKEVKGLGESITLGSRAGVTSRILGSLIMGQLFGTWPAGTEWAPSLLRAEGL